LLHRWLRTKRREVPSGTVTARAIDYSLKDWQALMRYIDDGDLPIDNNWVENQIRPQHAAAVMSLVQAARMNGHNP